MSKIIAKYYIVVLAALLLFGCNKRDLFFDKYAEKNQSDFVKALVRDKSDKSNKDKDSKYNSIPKTSNMLSLPKPPSFSQGTQLISLSVTDDVDLRDVLIELGRVTGIDVDIDPEISGGIILNAKNRPLIEVIQRICKLGSLKYSFENGVLSFKNDTPYSKHYVVNYLADGGLWDEVSSNITSILDNTTEDSSISLNKSAGIITIYSNDVGQKAAEEYLAEVKKNAYAQVLIEAKIVEVTLNDKYNAGIDWSFVGKSNSSISNLPGAAGGSVSFSIARGALQSLSIKALEQFGTARAISNPRISTLNNKKATLDFVDKLIYFTIETENVTTATTATTNTNSVTATKHEEPVGISLDITPAINLKENEVILTVHPKLTSKSGEINDPSVDSKGNNLGNKIPVIQNREIQTSMKLKSGDVLVIGGLMSETSNSDDKGFPFLKRIPVLGLLFKSLSKEYKKTETVILIKSTIVDSAGNSQSTQYDKKLLNDFDPSKRPFL